MLYHRKEGAQLFPVPESKGISCAELLKNNSRIIANEDIRAEKVLVVGVAKKPIVMETDQAMQIAKQEGLDLIQVSVNSSGPVCKIMERNKYAYQRQISKKKKQKKQKKDIVKEFKISPNIAENDLSVKERQIRKCLDSGYSVKITMVMRGRERSHSELHINKLQRFASRFEGCNKKQNCAKDANSDVSIYLIKKISAIT